MITEYRSQALERVLRTMHAAVPGILASVIVNSDGLLVAAYPSSEGDQPHENPTSSPQVAAMAATLLGLAERTLRPGLPFRLLSARKATLLGLAERTLRRLAQGHVGRLVLESDEGIMLIYPAGRAALAVLVQRGVKPGRVLYAANRARQDVVQILEG